MIKTLNEQAMLKALANAGVGSKVFVSYLPGRPAKGFTGLLEAQRAIDEGLSLRHFTGTLEALKVNKKDEAYMLLWALERDSLQSDGSLTEGNYRAMNPSLGKLLTIEVLDPMRDCWFAL